MLVVEEVPTTTTTSTSTSTTTTEEVAEPPPININNASSLFYEEEQEEENFGRKHYGDFAGGRSSRYSHDVVAFDGIITGSSSSSSSTEAPLPPIITKEEVKKRCLLLSKKVIVFLMVLLLLRQFVASYDRRIPADMDETSLLLSPYIPELLSSTPLLSLNSSSSSTMISPIQQQALDWLVRNDDGLINMKQDSTTTGHLLDRFVLAIVYYSTNGNKWKKNRRWLSRKSVCSWYIKLAWRNDIPVKMCPHDGDDRVDTIYLSQNNLVGTIPTEIGTLTTLTSLGLRFNDLTGNIPTELSHLTALKFLGLASNKLSGSVPTELHTFLESLDNCLLGCTGLTGIPANCKGCYPTANSMQPIHHILPCDINSTETP